MISKIILLSLVIFMSSSIFAQSYYIAKIIDTNLFETNDGQIVKFYGLYIPSRQDSNQALANIAADIYQWEIDNLLDQNFSAEIYGEANDKIVLVNLFKNYPFFVKENLIVKFLSLGYASLLETANKTFIAEMREYQEEAQNNKLGMWKEDLMIKKNIDIPIFIPKQQIIIQKSRPYLPLLGIGIASLALAWDGFATASDVQSNIDKLNNDINLIPKIYSSIELRKQIENGIKDEIENLKKIKSRKVIVGVTCLVAGIITTLYSFKTVEIKTDLQSIKFSYKF